MKPAAAGRRSRLMQQAAGHGGGQHQGEGGEVLVIVHGVMIVGLEANDRLAEPNHIDEEKRTLILTGASRGIGHATVKRFSSAGWRVITCSRHAFPENCPWAAGPEDHIQVDLADPADTERAVAEMRARLTDGKLHALVNNAAISPKGEGGARMNTLETAHDAVAQGVRGEFLLHHLAGARA